MERLQYSLLGLVSMSSALLVAGRVIFYSKIIAIMLQVYSNSIAFNARLLQLCCKFIAIL